MNRHSDILDDLFHGCALEAFVQEARACGGWPDSDATRRRAYAYYEAALAARGSQEQKSVYKSRQIRHNAGERRRR